MSLSISTSRLWCHFLHSSGRRSPRFFSATQLGRWFWTSSFDAKSLFLHHVDNKSCIEADKATLSLIKRTHAPTHPPVTVLKNILEWIQALPEVDNPLSDQHGQGSQEHGDVDKLSHVGVTQQHSPKFSPPPAHWLLCGCSRGKAWRSAAFTNPRKNMVACAPALSRRLC